jgi:hypothetical protein
MPVLPHPQQLAALGAVLCLHRTEAGGELAGWSQAARAVSESASDSDGLCESIRFFDADGRCCWQLFLLPDTDFLAWERMAAKLPAARAADAGLGIAERLWRRLAHRLGHAGWQANVLQLHALAAGPGFAGMSLLAASLPRLSACGADMARRIVRNAGIECGSLLDDCCCRQASIQSILPADGDNGWPWPPGFNTRTHA